LLCFQLSSKSTCLNDGISRLLCSSEASGALGCGIIVIHRCAFTARSITPKITIVITIRGRGVRSSLLKDQLCHLAAQEG
jgi:hypothetical protein